MRNLAALLSLFPLLASAQINPAPAGPGTPNPAQPQPIPGAATMQEPDPVAALIAELPPVSKVLEGYKRVVSSVDGERSLYTLFRRDKDQQLLAELPREFEKQKHFIALTVASGETYAGLQAGEYYVYWARYGKRLALMEPNLEIRSTGDDASKSSVKRLFTDRVLLDVPILSWVPNGGPIIDLDDLLVGKAAKFFGNTGFHPTNDEAEHGDHDARMSASHLGPVPIPPAGERLVRIKTAKAFPHNIEVGFEIPGPGGQLRTLHYSISLMPENTGYQPRIADSRVGYFTTSYKDYGKFKPDESRTRFINRWHLEKADPSLKLSPPKVPIVFYIEHTTPVRYRRWVQQGLLGWNKAFEKIGLVNAIEVRFQDATTGENMEKDPEDVRYNFIRWLSNGQGTAIGPSRVNPLTGQILDADIILTDAGFATGGRSSMRSSPKSRSRASPRRCTAGCGTIRSGIPACGWPRRKCGTKCWPTAPASPRRRWVAIRWRPLRKVSSPGMSLTG